MVDVVIDHSRELIGKFLWVIALAFLNTKLLHYLMRTNVASLRGNIKCERTCANM